MNTLQVSDAATTAVVMTLEAAGFDVEYNPETDEYLVSNPADASAGASETV